MVYMARRVAPRVAGPTDPGYETVPDRRPQVLFSDWTPRDAGPHEENVEVYSNAEQVELFLNGKSLGSKARPADDSARNWKVTFEPGTLRAVASNQGQSVATYELQTAGRPARIVLNADRTRLTSVWDDVSYVTVTVVDDHGVLAPNARDLITFKIAGAGVVAVVDSGDNSSHELFQASERHTYQGRCVVMIKANAPSGKIILEASAPGLAQASFTINATR